jgi:hypothetical protein
MMANGSRGSLSDYPAEKARQGTIILRHHWQRVLFIAGLGGCVLFLLITFLFPGTGH